MELRQFNDLVEFESAVAPFLSSKEIEHSLFLGLLTAFQSRELPADRVMVEVLKSGATALAAFYTGHVLILSDGCEESIEPLVDRLRGADLPGVVGPIDTVKLFASKWRQARDCQVSDVIEQRIYSATEILPPRNVIGGMRLATDSDLEILIDWIILFHKEATPSKPFSEDMAVSTAHRLIDEKRLYFWINDDGLVSMASWGRPTQNTVSVNAVFTPVEHRRRGYASAVAAGVSQVGLDMGKKWVVLYTDLFNKTSNKIYKKLGYRPVCDSRNVWFQY